MAELEKVLKGLASCGGGELQCPEECPYVDECGARGNVMFEPLAREALQVMRERIVPRVLEATEIPDWDGAVYMELRDEGVIGWVLFRFEWRPNFRFGMGIDMNVDEYGTAWRCWSQPPTEEQRAATAWLP